MIRKLLRSLIKKRILFKSMIKILMLSPEISVKFKVEGKKLIIVGNIVKRISLSDVCNLNSSIHFLLHR